jgi:acetyl esterase
VLKPRRNFVGKSKYKINKEFSSFNIYIALANRNPNENRKETKDRNIKIKSADGKTIKCRIIEPKHVKENAPCLIYYHGGAFRKGIRPYHLRLAHRYAYRAQCIVVVVDYRMVPKYPFPTPVEDSYTALKWVYENASVLGIDARRIAVGGDSSGGTLAAAVTQMARDRNGPHICFQLLVFPLVDCDMQTESMNTFGDVTKWNLAKNKEMWAAYLKNGDHGKIAYASPIKAASLVDLPPAYVETAEFDCLRDEGVNYARKLEKAGVLVELSETKGTIHGYDIVFKSIAKKNFEKRIIALNKVFESARLRNKAT